MDTCTDDIIQGVVAMDIKYNSFHSFIDETIKDLEQDHYCGQHYTCEDSICETRYYFFSVFCSLCWIIMAVILDEKKFANV